MSCGIHDGMVCDLRKPGHEASWRSVGEAVQLLRGGQEYFLENVVRLESPAQSLAHLVVHQHGKPPLILPEQQAERLLFAPLEAFH